MLLNLIFLAIQLLVFYKTVCNKLEIKAEKGWILIIESENIILSYSIWGQGTYIFVALSFLTVIQSCKRWNKIYLKCLSAGPDKW